MFSQVSGSYQQYTADHSDAFLKRLCKECLSSNQIAIHRDGNLMYYAYIYKASESEIYGLCIVCGEICLNIRWLYDFFQKAIEGTAYKGILFRYDEEGRICKNVDSFAKEVAEIDSLFREVREYINGQQLYWEALPPEDFSVPLESKISLTFSENDKEKITDAIRHYHNVVVTMENTAPSSFAKIVDRLASEKMQLQEEKTELESEVEYLSKQKKQFRWVVILSVAVIAGLVGLYFLNGSLNDTKNQLLQARNTIEEQELSITALNDEMRAVRAELIGTKASLKVAIEERDTARVTLDRLGNMMPIAISDIEIANTYYSGSMETDYGYTIYSHQSMYLKPRITYTGIKTGENIDLYVKLYTPSGLSTGASSPQGYTFSESMYVYSGENTETLLGWGSSSKGHWRSGKYRFEIWYGNVCLKAKSFTIH